MKLVKTTEYLLFINEEREPFNVGNIGVKYKALKAEDRTLVIANDSNLLSIEEHWRKVIAYYPIIKEAKELDLPLLPYPFKEVNVGKLAERYLQKWRVINNVHLSNRIHADRCKNDFIAGYKAAQSSNKQYSLEDMKKAFQAGTQSGYEFCDLEHYYNEQESQLPDEEIPDEDEEFEEFIQSLSTQQLPKEFVLGEGETIEEQIRNGKYI